MRVPAAFWIFCLAAFSTSFSAARLWRLYHTPPPPGECGETSTRETWSYIQGNDGSWRQVAHLTVTTRSGCPRFYLVKE